MADLSQMSDEELMSIAGINKDSNIQSMSDDELLAIARGDSPKEVVDTDIFGREFGPGERSFFGNIFERPGKASMAVIREDPKLALLGPFAGLVGTSGLAGEKIKQVATEASNFPERVPTFLEESQSTNKTGIPITGNKFIDRGTEPLRFHQNLTRDVRALAGDILVNPGDVLSSFAGGGVSKVFGKQIANSSFGKQASKILNSEIAPNKFFSNRFSKFRTDFLNEKVSPKVIKLFNDSVNNFTSGVQKFMKTKQNVNDDLIQHISNKSPRTVKATQQAMEDSLDNIALDIKKGFDGKNREITQLYRQAFNNIDDSTTIPIDDAFDELRGVLQKNGYIDNVGNLTSIAQSPSADPKLSSLVDIYEFLSPSRGAGTTFKQRSSVGAVNKTVWQNVRGLLSKSSVKGGKSGLTDDIVRISDRLHDQASKSGLQGIDEARAASREFFKHADLLKQFDATRVQSADTRLSNVFKKSKINRDLQTIDKYLDSNFTDTTKDIVSARELAKFEKLGQDFIEGGRRANLLEATVKDASNPANFERSKRFLNELLGESDDLTKIFNEIRNFQKAQKIKSGIGRAAGTGAAIGGGILIGRTLGER